MESNDINRYLQEDLVHMLVHAEVTFEVLGFYSKELLQYYHPLKVQNF